MFTTSRTKSYRDSFTTYRASKATSNKRRERSFREKDLLEPRRSTVIYPPQISPTRSSRASLSTPTSPSLNTAIVTIYVGPSQRLFAAHEGVLCKSPFLADLCRNNLFEGDSKRIDLPTEDPWIFSVILEYLYKTDYRPRLDYDEKRRSWYLEDGGATSDDEGTIWLDGAGAIGGGAVLKDTIIYCSAQRYALPELQRLALKKQGLQAGVSCSAILASARYAYANTPASDSKLRAHYLALIIRSRSTFKRSGTMQTEMQAGGTPLFFDLFVALVNHLDDLTKEKR